MSILQNLLNLDIAIFLLINKGLANTFFDFILFYFDKLSYVIYALLILFSIIKNRNLAVLLMLALIFTGVFIHMLKQAIGRERPYEVLNARLLVAPETNKSFPSNHAAQAFLVATLVFSYYRRLGILLFPFAIVISLGRVYLGVHYPSDVIVGAVLGVIIALVFKLTFYKIKFR
ncbi:MAG: phosphatase PAP2 family protein [Candidatus Aenigmatarchaeota archaeon]|nr:phosphatase PAP2 family protein [Candidatus Aenigmarchaeota archaeon]